jgi:hypothetical protein
MFTVVTGLTLFEKLKSWRSPDDAKKSLNATIRRSVMFKSVLRIKPNNPIDLVFLVRMNERYHHKAAAATMDILVHS